MTLTDTLDRGDLDQLRTMLTKANADKHDVVAPPSCLTAALGKIVGLGAGPEMAPDTVEAILCGQSTVTDLVAMPTGHAVNQLADKLDIPGPYLRRCHAEHVELHPLIVAAGVVATGRARRIVEDGVIPADSVPLRLACVVDRAGTVDWLSVCADMPQLNEGEPDEGFVLDMLKQAMGVTS